MCSVHGTPFSARLHRTWPMLFTGARFGLPAGRTATVPNSMFRSPCRTQYSRPAAGLYLKNLAGTLAPLDTCEIGSSNPSRQMRKISASGPNFPYVPGRGSHATDSERFAAFRRIPGRWAMVEYTCGKRHFAQRIYEEPFKGRVVGGHVPGAAPFPGAEPVL